MRPCDRVIPYLATTLVECLASGGTRDHDEFYLLIEMPGYDDLLLIYHDDMLRKDLIQLMRNSFEADPASEGESLR